MSLNDRDTIAAVATASGRGGIGIVRVSGNAVTTVMEHVLGRRIAPRQAALCHFRDAEGNSIDQGVALYFPGPASFTGEDVLELQGHGGPVVLDMVLQAALDSGARLARPGEFTERAFLNDKLDLAQAEAVADLIDSASRQAVRGALRSLQGDFSRRVDQLVEMLIEARMYVEAAIDFPEEEVDFLQDRELAQRLASLQAALQQLLKDARQGALLRDGMHVVLAGRPNAGKSSLLNALAGEDTAIVTDIAGTTRDVLRERISLDGLPLHVADTAGLRDSEDPVEAEGIRRAWLEIERADRILYIIDVSQPYERDLPRNWREYFDTDAPRAPITFVLNKIDTVAMAPQQSMHGPHTVIALSAKEGIGIAPLREHLKECMGYSGAGEGLFTARQRHLEALRRAAGLVDEGCAVLQGSGAGELLAEDLRLAQQALGEITGEFSADDLLGRIFSSFCIGK